jgi:membrane protein DedA with SNARE-associated domain
MIVRLNRSLGAIALNIYIWSKEIIQIARGKKWYFRTIKFNLIDIALIIGFLILSAAIFIFRDAVNQFGAYSYFGAFAIALIGDATFIPTPGWAIIMALGAALNPWAVGIAAGIGAALGDGIGYTLGYKWKLDLAKSNRLAPMAKWIQSHSGLILFVLALIPNPVFILVAIIIGASGYKSWKFFIFTVAGRIPKMILYATAGTWILNLIRHL